MRPKDFKRLDDDTIRIVWDDDHNSDYALAYLRKQCPCAACRGEEDNPLRVISGQPTHSVDITDVQQVGHYALQFTWSDGHSTGIYTYEYLRTICPCPECSGRAST